LLDLQRHSEARAQLENLTRVQPESPEPWLLLATLQVQDKRLAAATQSLQTYMGLARQEGGERGARGLTQAYLLMAQIAEKQKDFADAGAWLDRIENADDIMAAQMRRASLLAHQGQMPQARALLRNHPERRPEDARLKFVAEAQLLRDFKEWEKAYEVYGEAVARFPSDTELMYDQAMMSEKFNRLDAMEKLFRQVIAAKPDHHHAYNALGYSMADRNTRLQEAYDLIRKAVSLAPEDPYIMDSLGWVEFRLGRLEQAEATLRRAYDIKADPEIAAHLGEVLWVLGREDEAKKLWRNANAKDPRNETLKGTLQRLQVKL
jgi:tetratricopeptide (TPR) repeat protein